MNIPELKQLGYFDNEKEEHPCGQWVIYFSPIKGDVQQVQMRCHDYRNCELCADIRAREEMARLKDESAEYVVIRVDDEKKTASRLSRHGIPYRRYPGEDETVFLCNYQDMTDTDYSFSFVYDLEAFVDEHVITPAGKRITGKLGAAPERPEPRNTDDIPEEHFESVTVKLFPDDDDGNMMSVLSECAESVIEDLRSDAFVPGSVQDLIHKIEGRFITRIGRELPVVSVKRYNVDIRNLVWFGVSLRSKIKLYKEHNSDYEQLVMSWFG